MYEEHYFLERFLGVAIYAILAVVFSWLITQKRLQLKVIFWLYIFCLALLAYFFIPTVFADLYRIWKTAELYNSFPIAESIQKVYTDWSASLGLIYTTLISRFNPHLLPCLTAIIFYINIFYIIENYAIKNKISKKVVAAVVFLYMSMGVYGELISDIRNFLAFSFVARCIYDEVYNKKNFVSTLPWYIFAALFHNAALVAVLIWFVIKAMFLEKKSKILYICFTFAVCILFYGLFGNAVHGTLLKSQGYLTLGGYSYIWESILNTIYLCITIIIFNSAFRPLSLQGKKIKTITYIFLFISVICMKSYSIYHRYIIFSAMLSLPVFLEILNQPFELRDRFYRKKLVTCQSVVIIASLLLFFTGLKGNLNVLRVFF